MNASLAESAGSTSTLRTTLVGSFLFFQAFGVKLGVVDVTALVNLFAAALLLNRSYVTREQVRIILCLMFFVGWTILVSTISGVIDTYTINRNLRFFVSGTLLAVVVNGAGLRWAEIVRAVNSLMLLHAFMIYAQIMSPSLKQAMAQVLFDPEFLAISDPWGLKYLWRAFGLAGSYDMAGMYVTMGMVTSWAMLTARRGSRWHLAGIFFLWGAGLLTGRTFMLIGTAILGMMMLRMFQLGGVRLKISMAVLGTVSLGLFFYLFFDLLVFSLGLAERLGYEEDPGFTEQGYATNSLQVLQASFALPGTIPTLLFGTLRSPEWTDNGFLKIIFTHGIVGLFAVTAFYAFLVRITATGKPLRVFLSGKYLLILSVTALIFIFNYKVLLFGSRNVSEIYLLMIYSLLRENATGPDRCA